MKAKNYEQRKLKSIVNFSFFSFVFFVLFMSQTVITFAQVNIVKEVSHNQYNVGDELIVKLKITNDYSEDINLKIKDENVISGVGTILKCLEKNVKANSEIEYEYTPITLTKPGKYILDSAKADYVYQGKTNTIESNDLEINVEGIEDSTQSLSKITEIMFCDGIKSESTKIVSSTGGSSSSFSVNIGGNTQNAQQINSDNTSTQSSKIDPEYLVLMEIINSDEKYLEEKQIANQKGFILQERVINATSNASGFFKYTFKNADKERFIVGYVNDSKVQTVQTISVVSNTMKFFLFLLTIFNIIFIVFFFRLIKKRKLKFKQKIKLDKLNRLKSLKKIGFVNAVNQKLDADENIEKKKLTEEEKRDEKYSNIMRQEIKKALNLHVTGMDKDSLVHVLNAVRIYAKLRLNIDPKKEMTDNNIIEKLKQKGKKYKSATQILELNKKRFTGELTKKDIKVMFDKLNDLN
jgi:hypothetical protein